MESNPPLLVCSTKLDFPSASPPSTTRPISFKHQACTDLSPCDPPFKECHNKSLNTGTCTTPPTIDRRGSFVGTMYDCYVNKHLLIGQFSNLNLSVLPHMPATDAATVSSTYINCKSCTYQGPQDSFPQRRRGTGFVKTCASCTKKQDQYYAAKPQIMQSVMESREASQRSRSDKESQH